MTQPHEVDRMHHSDEAPAVVDPREVALKMKLEYSHGIKDHTTKALEDIAELCSRLERSDLDLNVFLKDSADLISKHFGIASVCIVLWNPSLALYKFRAVTGLQQDAVKRYNALGFTKEQIRDEKTYPSHEISKQTKLYLSEEHPYAQGEESTYARPGLLGMKRRSTTDSLEGDYLCVFFHGPDGEVLGWIEVSGTRLWKLPDATTIKWIELIARMIGVAVLIKR